MVLDLVILGLAITLMPVTIVAFGLIVSAEKGVWKGLAFLSGWLVCVVAVVAFTVLVTGGKPPRPHTAPSNAALLVKAAIGGLLIWVAFRQWHHMGRPHKQPSWMARLDHMSLWALAGFGAFMLPWSLVAAAAATVVQANLATVGSWLALVFFSLLSVSSFLVIELYTVLSPEAAGARIERLRGWIDRHQDQAIVIGALLVGCWLLGKSLYLIVGA